MTILRVLKKNSITYQLVKLIIKRCCPTSGVTSRSPSTKRWTCQLRKYLIKLTKFLHHTSSHRTKKAPIPASVRTVIWAACQCVLHDRGVHSSAVPTIQSANTPAPLVPQVKTTHQVSPQKVKNWVSTTVIKSGSTKGVLAHTPSAVRSQTTTKSQTASRSQKNGPQKRLRSKQPSNCYHFPDL